ncbi:MULTISPECIES: urea transporter [unclassified Corynebacterium]|uniref:urea transporter n=1 Tax=unclassified Corynebacterium TaxID=2624378 RepID=UPI0029CA8402|nr:MULTISPECIES: urea transporter [unclassified Corynebacterium]WPF66409.1 urea transporter [Corynebacterium sp. 22KM0430]WPF68899.1 urea transporter [Corynebacterium sp. 21KM1197]
MSLFSSLSQIYLVSSWRAGVVIALALALFSPALAAGALTGAVLGIACHVVFSWWRRWSPRLTGTAPAVTAIDAPFTQRARSGLLGYNGALIGALVLTRCEWTMAALVWMLLGVLGAVAVQVPLERFLACCPGTAGLPVLTAPFCAMGTVLSLTLPAAVAAPPAGEMSLGFALLGIPAAFAQVSLGSGWLVGLLILVALANAVPRTAAWGTGAAALTLPVLFWIPVVDFASGAWSYCAALVGIAVGATFTGEPDRAVNRAAGPAATSAGGSVDRGADRSMRGTGVWRHRVIPVMAAVALALLIQAAFLWAGWPVLTWPFVISTWAVLIVQGLRYGR